ncbi:MAG: hypothetical protein PHY09_16170 [Desulfuromonadaceae bacterium]|nr:hypothetical protein [Desulfuromonadaceae bacterium]MDD5105460.1 hypothetical protein [Desulfuromonadaceae bacterium]
MLAAIRLSPQDCDAVLFDLDGVLTRTVRVHDAAELTFSVCVEGKLCGTTTAFQLNKKAAGNPGESLKAAICTKSESQKPEVVKPCGN